MPVRHLFAGLAVTDYVSARGWYERLFRRPPDLEPKPDEGVWHVTDTASIYVVADPARAGTGLLTLAVDRLDDLPASLVDHAASGRHDASDDQPEGGSPPPKTVVRDPDGNTIAFFVDPRTGSQP